jgi:predicted Fe-Mo cluster-binding NifX family protein
MRCAAAAGPTHKTQTFKFQPFGVKRKDNTTMKIAVTSRGADLDAQVDPRFGRAAYILIVDSDSFAFEAINNDENLNAMRGAGIQAASLISDKGAEVLLTGSCGPNAFRTLASANVKVAIGAAGTVREAVTSFKEGKLRFAEEADVEGHW